MLILRTFLASLMVLLSATVVADAQYWVAIASYSTEENAQTAKANSSARLSEPMTVSGTDTGSGYFFRVLAGPYGERDLAAQVAEQARSSGFSGAWVLRDQSSSILSDTFVDPYSSDDPQYGSGEFDGSRDRYALPSGDNPDGESQNRPSNDKPEPEMVDEAPPGYRLHKLRRDARARPPPGSTESPPDTLEVNLHTDSPLQLTRLPHSQSNIKIDGKLQESIWATLPAVTEFYAVEPDTGEEATLLTELRMFYTEKGLYVSFNNVQPHDSFVSWIIGRDKGFESGDHVGITLDTSGEGLYGYWMSISLGDVQSDGTLLPERRFSRDWDGAWYGRSAVTEDGWSAEMYVPWSQVTMPRREGARKMGLYASRKFSQANVRWGMPNLPPTRSVFISDMRQMHMEGVDPQQQWSVIPYTSLTQDEVEDGTSAKVGAEVFWRPSTNFQLSGTLNPDFGNVESDNLVVNLSAFETFFPERRLFFLEGREIFETTPRSNPFSNRDPVSIVNTRRIGGRPRPPAVVPDGLTLPLRELSQPTELQAAVKTTGQVGRLRYGLLAASEDEVKFDLPGYNLHQDGSDYGVARFMYEDSSAGAYRAVGTISTLVAHPEQDVMVHGVDGHYRTASGKWITDAQLLYSKKDVVGEGYGGLVDVVFTPRRGLKYNFGLSHYDQRLDINDLGFLRRNDVTNLKTEIDYTTTSFSWARELKAVPFAQWEWNGDGRATRRGFGSRVNLLLNNFASIESMWAYFPQRYEDRESFGNGTYVIEGRHDSLVKYTSDDARRFRYHAQLSHGGEQQGGSLIKGAAGVLWRPLDRMTVDLTAEYWRRDGWLLHQEDRNFTTFKTTEWRPRLSVEYNFNARQQLKFAAQWVAIKAREKDFYQIQPRVDDLLQVNKPVGASDDFAISNLNLQLRYRWEIAPLSDLFVVYTLNGFRSSANRPFEDLFDDTYNNPDVEQLVVKLRYRFGS